MTQLAAKPVLTQCEKIPVAVYARSEEVSVAVAKEIADLIRDRAKDGKTCVLGLATGFDPGGGVRGAGASAQGRRAVI